MTGILRGVAGDGTWMALPICCTRRAGLGETRNALLCWHLFAACYRFSGAGDGGSAWRRGWPGRRTWMCTFAGTMRPGASFASKRVPMWMCGGIQAL